METELLVKHNTLAYTETGIYANPTLFKILSFPIVKGSAAKPLTDIKSIAISERLAQKLFKNENPIGKTLNLGASHELIVTSVFVNIPQHSNDRLGEFI